MRAPPRKICPLMEIANIGRDVPPTPCLEDRCAWFHLEFDPEDGTADGRCVMLRIANHLAPLARKEEKT